MIYDFGPRARRVYDTLRRQLVEGVFPPASRLPSHIALAATFHVAPLTVRQVLSRLEDEGWVSRQQGRGTFVCLPPPPLPPAAVPGPWPLAWLEQMDDVAVAFSTDGQVRYWNPSATTRLGSPMDDGHGPRADHIYPAYMWQRWQSAAPATPRPQDWRWQGPGRAGGTLWLEGRLYPLQDGAGQLDGILCLGRDVTAYKQEEQDQTTTIPSPASGPPAHDQARIVPEFTPAGKIEFVLTTAHDITARQQAEEALRYSEERLTKVFHASPDTIAILRLADGCLVDVNESWLQTFGYSRDEVLGRVVPGLVLTEDATERERLVGLLHEHGAVHDYEVISYRKNGELRQFSLAVEQIDLAGEACLLVTGRDITERKQAWIAQSRSEERLAKVFRSSPVGIAISRLADGVIIEANDVWLTTTGYSREEVIGQSSLALKLWADPQDRDHLITTLRQQGVVHQQELPFRQRSGEIRQGLISLENIEMDNEACLLLMVQDITERQQAEAALRRSEDRFAKAFRSSPMGIGISRLSDGQIIDVNDHWVQLTGYSREEAIGQRGTTLNLWARPEDRMRVVTPIEEHSAPHEVETSFRHKTGRVYQASVSAEVIEIDGEPCMLMLSRDITAEKQAQDALRRSEERFAKVFRASPDAIAISRATDGRIVDVNESWTRLFGYSREDAIGQTTVGLGLWVDQEDCDEITRLLQQTPGVLDHSVMFRQRNGQLIQGSVSIEIVEIDGESCMLAMIRDITERQQMEERAREAERLGALGRVAAGVAHEFNNVLAGIMGRLDLLMTESQDARFNAQLRLIQQSAEDGAAVVARIGRFARVHDTSVRSLIHVQELINDVITLTEPRRRRVPDHRSQPVTVRTHIVPGLMVQGNPTELREVLTNLIFNATDAMAHGGQITIIAGTQEEHVVMVVQDEGNGIDPAIQARIFEPFFTTKVTGSGLGLALVKNIIEAHGGEISVSSPGGRGTRFNIRLPAATTAPAPAPAPPALTVNRTARILIVDDDARLCEMLQMLLLRGGHEVVVETSGAEAVARLDTGPFDLVCTDLGMPGMNGWEVAEQVRQRAPGTRIALITGWGNQLDPADLAHHQIDFVLPKPYRSAQVQDLVLQALTRGPRPPAEQAESAS